MSVCVDANITGTFRKFFLQFIINYFNVYYKISTPVVFCPYTREITDQLMQHQKKLVAWLRFIVRQSTHVKFFIETIYTRTLSQR